ncbi:DUF421 domain-containing protein [uncultured Sulfitobacter sp.]|uniref:DUF421 domain-containing protein n=1 Tax=uncultured Sulfitobacter sp. TaxID=191468 RepID=UPI002607735D|nr:YetF domain-containing protein [uncultured Sulfitobacter sp.]
MIFETLPYPEVWRGLVLGAVSLVWIILMVRIVGLRSFSKMTSFDFVVTVALGSLLAGAAQATKSSGFVQALVAITTLMGLQFLVALARRKSAYIEDIIGNTPVILMEDGIISDAALCATRVSRSDLIAKLREANAIDPDISKTVVLEATGDISVLHGKDIDSSLLTGLRRY